MIIYVDIDDTICYREETHLYEYNACVPFMERIQQINELYDSGYTIVYWTARGTRTGIDWRDITLKQFEKWGVKFHELKFKKPEYDLFICDKAISTNEYFKVVK